jgi:thiol:disulfide interchange protein DsbC
MKKFVLALLLMLFMSSNAYAFTKVNSGIVQKVLPKVPISSVYKTPIRGLYAAVLFNGQILYVNPVDKTVLLGQMFTIDGKNLTTELMVYMEKSNVKGLLKHINLKMAIKIGNGPNKIIEFINPDCPFCRLSEKFLSGKNVSSKVTRYIFLLPQLDIHPHSLVMTEFIYNHKNKEKWVNKIMIGDMKNVRYNKLKFVSASALKHVHYNQRMAKKYNINAVPFLIINGHVILGFNQAKISNLLGLKTNIVNINKLSGN